MFTNIIHHQVNRLHLIIPQCIINSCSIIKVSSMLFRNLVFVDYRVFWIEVLFVFVGEKTFDRAAVKSKNRNQSGEIKFQESFVEYLWIRLQLYQLNDFLLCSAEVKTLENHQLSQRNLTYFNLKNTIKMGFKLFW